MSWRFFISFRAPNLDYGAGVCKLYHFVYEELKYCVYYSGCGCYYDCAVG